MRLTHNHWTILNLHWQKKVRLSDRCVHWGGHLKVSFLHHQRPYSIHADSSVAAQHTAIISCCSLMIRDHCEPYVWYHNVNSLFTSSVKAWRTSWNWKSKLKLEFYCNQHMVSSFLGSFSTKVAVILEPFPFKILETLILSINPHIYHFWTELLLPRMHQL